MLLALLALPDQDINLIYIQPYINAFPPFLNIPKCFIFPNTLNQSFLNEIPSCRGAEKLEAPAKPGLSGFELGHFLVLPPAAMLWRKHPGLHRYGSTCSSNVVRNQQ